MRLERLALLFPILLPSIFMPEVDQSLIKGNFLQRTRILSDVLFAIENVGKIAVITDVRMF